MGSIYSSQVKPQKNKNFFNIRQFQKIFLLGTNICDDSLERFDDMEIIGLKSLLKMNSIEFYFYEQNLIGYETIYEDQFDNLTCITRLPQKFKKSKQAFVDKRNQIIFEENEHIVSIGFTFSFESINSIQIATNLKKKYEFGKTKEFTSFSTFDQKFENNINVVTSFSGSLDYCRVKEIFIYRSQCQIKIQHT